MRNIKTFPTSNHENSTFTRNVRHLFTLNDSFLWYESQKNPNFSLEDFRKFDSSSFQHLQYPSEWLLSTCGTDGNKGLDRLKSHADLRLFLQSEVHAFNQGKEFFEIKKSVLENLENVEKQISSNKLFRKFNIKSNVKKHKTDTAKMILEPAKQKNIENIVSNWHKSPERDEVEKDMEFIYENAIKTQNISAKNLTKYCNFARVYLLLRLS